MGLPAADQWREHAGGALARRPRRRRRRGPGRPGRPEMEEEAAGADARHHCARYRAWGKGRGRAGVKVGAGKRRRPTCAPHPAQRFAAAVTRVPREQRSLPRAGMKSKRLVAVAVRPQRECLRGGGEEGRGPEEEGWGRVHGGAEGVRGGVQGRGPASGMPRARWEREASRAADQAPLTEPGAWDSLCNNLF